MTETTLTAGEPRGETAGPGPLAGVRVVEVGSLIAGPFGGRLLADIGADVIKIESPRQPDPLRDWGKGEVDGHSLWWPVQSRNKRCITLDLADDRGRDLFLQLVAAERRTARELPPRHP